jgi:Nitroreductase
MALAIKTFDKKRNINDTDFEFLLEIARFSPSSYGFEPWNIIVLQNQELRDKISSVTWGGSSQLTTASHYIIFTVKTDLDWNSKHYFKHILPDTRGASSEIITGIKESFKKFQEEQQDLTDERKRHDWAAKQAYIAMANMMSAAAMIGIDSCPIEGFYNNNVEEILSENNVINLDTDRLTVMAAFGYRDEKSPRAKSRREMSEIVKWV